MILIFGGAYQGKLEYAKAHFQIGRVHDCRQAAADAVRSAEAPGQDPAAVSGFVASADPDPASGPVASADPDPAAGEGFACAPDFSADAVCGIEAFARECAEKDMEAADWFRARRSEWQDRVLIMRDVSQGIVPMDPLTRKYREMNGRLMMYLAGEAEQVIRVFCGIGKRIR